MVSAVAGAAAVAGGYVNPVKLVITPLGVEVFYVRTRVLPRLDGTRKRSGRFFMASSFRSCILVFSSDLFAVVVISRKRKENISIAFSSNQAGWAPDHPRWRSQPVLPRVMHSKAETIQGRVTEDHPSGPPRLVFVVQPTTTGRRSQHRALRAGRSPLCLTLPKT